MVEVIILSDVSSLNSSNSISLSVSCVQLHFICCFQSVKPVISPLVKFRVIYPQCKTNNLLFISFCTAQQLNTLNGESGRKWKRTCCCKSCSTCFGISRVGQLYRHPVGSRKMLLRRSPLSIASSVDVCRLKIWDVLHVQLERPS